MHRPGGDSVIQVIRRALRGLFNRAGFATLGQVQESRDAIDRLYRDRIEELEAEVEVLTPRPSAAVAEADCPRCGASAGSRCRSADGAVLKRTHSERTAAWRAEEKEG